jgi:hypothetical protein
VSSASEISIVHAPPPVVDRDADAAGTTLAWTPVEVPRARRPTPTALVVLASCAGVGALLLGLLAGVFALSNLDEPTAPAATSPAPTAEQQALALLAKPSTQRIVFRGSGGRLLLAVGSGGRAAILNRGLERADGRPYGAWVVGSSRPIRAARFDGAERAVFLSVPLQPHESVVVSRTRPTGLNSPTQLVALR